MLCERFARRFEYAHSLLFDSSRSLDLVLGFLKLEDSDREKNCDGIEFWLGEHIFETIWQILFHVGSGREQDLAAS